jgi:hypothetical protein
LSEYKKKYEKNELEMKIKRKPDSNRRKIYYHTKTYGGVYLFDECLNKSKKWSAAPATLFISSITGPGTYEYVIKLIKLEIKRP